MMSCQQKPINKMSHVPYNILHMRSSFTPYHLFWHCKVSLGSRHSCSGNDCACENKLLLAFADTTSSSTHVQITYHPTDLHTELSRNQAYNDLVLFTKKHKLRNTLNSIHISVIQRPWNGAEPEWDHWICFLLLAVRKGTAGYFICWVEQK